jgi:hypothetical protein
MKKKFWMSMDFPPSIISIRRNYSIPVGLAMFSTPALSMGVSLKPSSNI